MFNDFVRFVKSVYNTDEFIPLHQPRFLGNEKKYVIDTIESTFVSSVGSYVNQFEKNISEFVGVKYAIATVNGTAALHIALKLVGVDTNDEVVTQSLTFVATCNAIRYCNAEPVFVDVNKETLGLSADSLQLFLEQNCEVRGDGFCWNKNSNRIVRACLPMHTFGFPVQLDEIKNICDNYNITLVEDAAESLGSLYKGKHTGTISKLAAISFNGNKIITTGGGGVVLTNDHTIAHRAKHITTTARLADNWNFIHDEIAYNYRLPNLNAALGVAQLELLPQYIKNKRQLASRYQDWGKEHGLKFIEEPKDTRSNYWLNTIIVENKKQKDALLKYTNDNGVMTRPVWEPMHKLEMNLNCQSTELKNTDWLVDRLINVPSSVVLNE